MLSSTDLCDRLNALDADGTEVVSLSNLYDHTSTVAIDPLGLHALFAMRDGWVIGPDDDGAWVVLGHIEEFTLWDDEK